MSAYEEAERRLGRKLTDSERRIDILGYDADLEEGKKRLYRAIEKEKIRVISQRVAGRRAKVKMTQEMRDALAWLHERGIAHAHAELRAAGVEPEKQYAADPRLRGLAGLLRLLQSMLGRVSRRIDLELKIRTGRGKQIDVRIDSAAKRALARAMEKKVPGSLAIAADLVSSAMARGLAEGFEPQADLFPCWEYSAVMDGATCANCRALDGTRYPNWAAIMVVLPDGGPNPLCLGNGRCRCRPVPCPLTQLFLPEKPPPKGVPPSEKVTISNKETVGYSPGRWTMVERADAEEALGLLDETFVLPADAPVIPVLRANAWEDSNTGGSFAWSFKDGPSEIVLNPSNEESPLVYGLAHEFGHYLDMTLGGNEDGRWKYLTHRAFGDLVNEGDRAVFLDSPLGEVFAAIMESPSFQKMHGRSWDEMYWENPWEVFARAVGQFVVTRQKNPGGLKYVKYINGKFERASGWHPQWEDDEFAPIGEALERFFRGQGLLRE